VHRRDGGDRAEAAGLVVGKGLNDFLASVHHERSHPGDGLADRAATEDEDVEVRAATLLDLLSGDRDRVERVVVAAVGPERQAGSAAAASNDQVETGREVNRPAIAFDASGSSRKGTRK